LTGKRIDVTGTKVSSYNGVLIQRCPHTKVQGVRQLHVHLALEIIVVFRVGRVLRGGFRKTIWEKPVSPEILSHDLSFLTKYLSYHTISK
jgi:hypothetical protein